MPSPAQTAAAARLAEQLAATPHRGRGALVRAAAADLGVSVQTLYTWMQAHTGRRRKVRADAHGVRVQRYQAAARAGATSAEREAALEAAEAGLADLALTADEARLIAAVLTESGRANGKQLMSLAQAVDTLRHQGVIRAERVDADTGEVIPLSLSAISRGLRLWHCHPRQLVAPTPHMPLRTRHPNARWEVDASVCVVYYLPGGGAVVEELDPAKHYKNKPQNLEAIASHRVIRYVVTDHCSGVVRWRYYPGSETGAHTVAFLAWAMAPKANRADPFEGAPLRLVADPGATSSGTVRRWCTVMGIDLHLTRVRNSRGKGSVEKGQDLVERNFESGLRFQRQRVTDFDSLNALAEIYQLHYNASATHTRTGKTRFAAWLEIPAEALRRTEPESVLRALASEAPATPKVSGELTVQYRRQTWDVRALPGVHVGQRLSVLWCPLIGADGRGHAVAVHLDADTERETYTPLARVDRDAWGFRADAPVDGETYDRHPDTEVDRTRKRLAMLASGTTTPGDDELARRRQGFRPLAHLDDGRGVDPYRAAETAEPQTYLPRRGVEHRVSAPEVAPLVLDIDTAALRLAGLVRGAGGDWGPERYSWLAARYPDGVPEDALGALVDACLGRGEAAPASAPGLRVVK